MLCIFFLWLVLSSSFSLTLAEEQSEDQECTSYICQSYQYVLRNIAEKYYSNKFEDLKNDFEDFKAKQDVYNENLKLDILQLENQTKEYVSRYKEILENVVSLQTNLTQLESLRNETEAIQRINSRLENIVRIVAFKKIGSKYYYVNDNAKCSWQGARADCQTLGGHLASLQSQEEMDNLRDLLTDGRQYWIDLNDIETEGKYVSETTGRNAEFLVWRKWNHSPDNWNNEDCIEITRDAQVIDMNDVKCSQPQHFICEREFL